MVKKAEVRMAEDQTLIPHVRMGVEARNLGFPSVFPTDALHQESYVL